MGFFHIMQSTIDVCTSCCVRWNFLQKWSKLWPVAYPDATNDSWTCQQESHLMMKVTLHRCPMRVHGLLTVCHSPFEQRHLLTLSDDTWKLTCSRATPPLTNCDHPHLWFGTCFDIWCATNATYLLTYWTMTAPSHNNKATFLKCWIIVNWWNPSTCL